MNNKPLEEYKDQCGSCQNFEPRVNNKGKVLKNGVCWVRGIKKYHDACQKCCLQYKEKKG